MFLFYIFFVVLVPIFVHFRRLRYGDFWLKRGGLWLFWQTSPASPRSGIQESISRTAQATPVLYKDKCYRLFKYFHTNMKFSYSFKKPCFLYIFYLLYNSNSLIAFCCKIQNICFICTYFVPQRVLIIYVFNLTFSSVCII